MKNKGTQKCRLIVILLSVAVIVLLFFIIVRTCKSCAETDSGLIGTWYYNEYTEYEFGEKGQGCLHLDGDTHFEYIYEVKNGIIYVDFKLDYVTDCQYKYTLNGDKLTLVGGEGTSEIGKTYELTRV